MTHTLSSLRSTQCTHSLYPHPLRRLKSIERDHVKTRRSRDVCISLVKLTTMAATSHKKAGRRRNENNVIYANPLPVIFSPIENRFAVTTLGILGISPTRVLNPRCQGTFDPISRSVWITDPKDRMVLWRRGFFGKGNLSRSEPSWLVRLTNSRNATGGRKPFCSCEWPHVLRISFRNNL